MKILKESKENLPIAFLTTFVSDGWERVGVLKEEIEAIKKEFSGTKKVEELIQKLIDAYLVCIGQMEQHLADKDYLDFEDTPVKEALTEDILVDVQLKDEPEVDVEEIKTNVENLLADTEELSDESESHVIVRDVDELEDPMAEETAQENDELDPFNCDFGAPQGEKLTDADLYPENN